MKNQTVKIILTTQRLILRTWALEDIPLMTQINIDPKVMEFFPSIQDSVATQKLVNHINEQYEKVGYTLYAVEIQNSGEFIGFTGLNQPSFNIPNFVPQGKPIVEIGWRLASQHWNKGYATEAAKAVLEYGFTQLKLEEIISFTTEVNIRSRRIMEKLGLRHNLNDDFEHPKLETNSPLRKHVLYRLSRAEYLASVT